MMVGIMFLLLGIATSCSDGDEAILPEQASAKMPATEVVVNKDSCMQLFSQILSKAVSQRQDVRMFLKAQALKKFDNDFNVFYNSSLKFEIMAKQLYVASQRVL